MAKRKRRAPSPQARLAAVTRAVADELGLTFAEARPVVRRARDTFGRALTQRDVAAAVTLERQRLRRRKRPRRPRRPPPPPAAPDEWYRSDEPQAGDLAFDLRELVESGTRQLWRAQSLTFLVGLSTETPDELVTMESGRIDPPNASDIWSSFFAAVRKIIDEWKEERRAMQREEQSPDVVLLQRWTVTSAAPQR